VAFLRYGRRLWPGVAIAAFLVNLPITNLPAALITAAGNTLAPMLAAWLLERVGFRQQIDRVRDVAALVVLGALLSMTVSATIGTAALELSSNSPLEGFWTAWSAWWAGDAMGILVVAPFLLCLLTWREVEPKLGWRRLPEALALLVLLVTASVFAMWNTGQLLFLIPPLLAWIAWRFQLRGAAPAVLLVSILAAWAATRGVGWFADLSLAQQMLTLQLFNATIAFTAFFLSALVSERMRARERLQRAADDLDVRVRQRTAQLVDANDQLGREIAERRDAETKLRRSERELAEAQDLARLGRWEWDLGSGAVTWSDDLYRIHGYEPGAFPMTFDKAVELVPDEDRQRIERNLAAALAMRRQEVPDIEYRIVRTDGELRA
ncbi:MAG: MASE1 domain-containing protein, partial [Gaiellaceae bacterium]